MISLNKNNNLQIKSKREIFILSLIIIMMVIKGVKNQHQ